MRLVRHGEVAEQHRGTFYGGAEVPLSPAGEAESLTLARALADTGVDHVASSPLSRALAVARPLARSAGVELTTHDGLIELDRGHWTHLHRDEIERRWPGAIAGYLADPEGGAAPGGEPESVFSARVWAALDALVGAHRGRRLVVVAHGHVIRVVLRRLLDLDAPASLTRFVPYHGILEAELEPDGRGRLVAAPPGSLPEGLQTSTRRPTS